MKSFAGAAAHNAISDDSLWCLITRRHLFPPPANETKVRVAYDGGTLETYESISQCGQCGTGRTLYRDQADEKFLWAVYTYADDYLPPTGEQWDRDYLKQLWRERHPVKGHTRIINR